MPSLLQPPFCEIIRLLPVDEHSEEIAANQWQDPFTMAGQEEHFQAIFHQQPNVRVSRGRLLNFEGGNHQQKCLEIMLWGYPRGWPARVTRGFLENVVEIAVHAPNGVAWCEYYSTLHRIGTLGVSTITKLAYFFNRSFEGNKALILDQKIIDVCASGHWAELQLPNLRYDNADTHYLGYLRLMDGVARTLKCRPDQVECFLFLFGRAF
jgi:hypothetical protein